MSYDLTFLPKTDDQSWEEAMDAAEEAESDGPPDPRVWRVILDGATAVLGEVDVFEGQDNYELTHHPTGIQVSLFSTEAGISVPYHFAGEDAKVVLRLIYQLGRIVEAATGWSGYDPQSDLPIAEAAETLGHGVETFDTVAVYLNDLRQGRS
jgi:hypothetical protein